jgi:hypothetical protein
MTVFEWIAAATSAVEIGSFLIALALARVLADIGQSAALLADDEWASAPLTRARRHA